jgi:hypothetical protein
MVLPERLFCGFRASGNGEMELELSFSGKEVQIKKNEYNHLSFEIDGQKLGVLTKLNKTSFSLITRNRRIEIGGGT